MLVVRGASAGPQPGPLGGRPAPRSDAVGQSRNAGAVYVEFLLAFLPLLAVFECVLQLAGLQAARLVTAHAATCAARAAAVVLHDHPIHYGGVAVGSATGHRRREVERAAALVLRAINGLELVRIGFPASPAGAVERSQFGPQELIRVRVTARYRCSIPLARWVVCGARSGRIRLAGEAALPSHGASYAYE